MSDIAVVLTSCDDYSDCWPHTMHFLKNSGLLDHFPGWLITDSYAGQPVEPLQVLASGAKGAPMPSWSDIRLRALSQIPAKYVLLLFEDFLIINRPNVRGVQAAAAALERHPELGAIYLSTCGPKGPSTVDHQLGIRRFSRFTRYAASLQAALWNKDQLMSLMYPGESIWQHELFASFRAIRKGVRPAMLSPDHFPDGLLEYVPTAIVKGKWLPEAVEDAARRGYAIDVSGRGIHVPTRSLTRRFTLVRHVLASPGMALRSLRG
jgi:hypothetical protein